MTWSFNIDEAPRGKAVTIVRTVKGEERPFDETVIAPVWLATQCGRVIKSYWLEKTKFSPARWAGLGTNEVPVAWQHFVTPEHPFTETDAAISRPGIASTCRPEIENRSDEEASESEASGGVQDRMSVHPATHIILEDCGSGA
jgi:hypothetical protein